MSDIEYWNKYYQSKKCVHFPSDFAEYCQNTHLPTACNLLELGTGNGRDSFYFSEVGHNVVGYDQSKVVVEDNCARAKDLGDEYKIAFKDGDFTRLTIGDFNDEIRVVYSRFTIHSINIDDQNRLLRNVFGLLPEGGKFCIEARTMKDPLYGQGKEVGEHEYVTDHYRRFIDTQLFLKETMSLGFKIEYFAEGKGFAVHGDEDPVVGRFILGK